MESIEEGTRTDGGRVVIGLLVLLADEVMQSGYFYEQRCSQ